MGGFRIGPGGISPFIKVIIIVNVAVFLFQQVSAGLIPLLGLTPTRFLAEFPNLIYQTMTYMFLHGSFGHIFFNMFALWMFGTEIEQTWGTRRFGRFYVYSGLAGAILTLIVLSSQAVPMIGASAAIYGILVAYWFMYPNRLLYIYFMFPVKVKWAIPGFMLLGLIFSPGNVAHMAHLGGALLGIIYMKSGWRPGWFSGKVKNLRYKQKESKFRRNVKQTQDVMNRVDAILDKINEVGIDNITKADRKFLEEASIELSKKQGKHSQ